MRAGRFDWMRGALVEGGGGVREVRKVGGVGVVRKVGLLGVFRFL